MDSLNLNGIERDVFKFAYGIDNKKLYIKDLKKFNNSSLIFKFLSDNKGLTLEWLESFPKAKWEFEILSTNPNLTLEWLELFPEANWDFEILSSNPLLTLEWLERFPEAKWNFSIISSNPLLTLEWLKSFPDEEWDFGIISSNPLLTFEWLELFPEEKWDFGIISSHPLLTLEWLKFIFNDMWVCGYEFSELCSHPNLTLEWLERFPKVEWDFGKLSSHPNLTLEWLERFPEAKLLERSSKTKWKWLVSYFKWDLVSYFKWDFKILSSHPNLTLEWLERFPEAKWDFKILSSCPNLTLEWLERFPEAKWNFGSGFFPNIDVICERYHTWDLDKHRYDFLYDLIDLSNHPNLTLEWLEKFPEANWNFSTICKRFNLIKLQLSLKNIPILKHSSYQTKTEKIICILLNKENFNYLAEPEKNDITFLKLLDEERLDEKQIDIIMILLNNNISIKTYNPGMFYNVFEPLYLQDLSGDKYEIYDWLETPNLLNLIRTTYPELGECDININDKLLSQISDQEFKRLMIENGTEAMIVYQVSFDDIFAYPNNDWDLEAIQQQSNFSYQWIEKIPKLNWVITPEILEDKNKSYREYIFTKTKIWIIMINYYECQLNYNEFKMTLKYKFENNFSNKIKKKSKSVKLDYNNKYLINEIKNKIIWLNLIEKQNITYSSNLNKKLTKIILLKNFNK